MKEVVASLGALKHRKQRTEADAAAMEKSLVSGPHISRGRAGRNAVSNQVKTGSPSTFPAYSTVYSQRWQLCEVMHVVG